jgi:PAS domain S-box-containing protein
MDILVKKAAGKKWLVWSAAFFITLTATGGILTLHRWSNTSHRAVELLSDLEAQANRLSAIEWEAMARKELIPELRQSQQRVRGFLDRIFDQLSFHSEDRDLQQLRTAFHKYAEAINVEFHLLDSGQFAEALRVDNERVDAAYAELTEHIGRMQSRYAASSRGTIWAVDAASTSVLFVAAIAIGLLFSRFEQIQRIRQVLLAEQKALRLSEVRFRSLVQNTSDIIAILDPLPPTIKFVSDSIRRILGHQPAELMGSDFLKLIHPGDTGTMQRFLVSCTYNPGSTYTTELRVRHSNGHWSTVEIYGDNRIEDDAIGGIVINVRDVSERKQVAEALDQRQIEFELPERKLH